MADERKVRQPFVGLDLFKRHRIFDRLHRLDVDHTETAGFIGMIGVMFLHHLDDADDALLVDRMIEEAGIALFHGLHVVVGLIVAHPVPVLDALFHLIVPGPGAGLGFEQPMGHDVSPFFRHFRGRIMETHCRLGKNRPEDYSG